MHAIHKQECTLAWLVTLHSSSICCLLFLDLLFAVIFLLQKILCCENLKIHGSKWTEIHIPVGCQAGFMAVAQNFRSKEGRMWNQETRGENSPCTFSILRSVAWGEWHPVFLFSQWEFWQEAVYSIWDEEFEDLLQSLEAHGVLCASVSLVIWKGDYLPSFHGWKMFVVYKAALLQIGTDSRRNSIAWIVICTLKQWGALILLCYKRVFLYPTSSSSTGFHFTGNCRYASLLQLYKCITC